MTFKTQKKSWNDRDFSLVLYIPSRTGMVLVSEDNAEKYNIFIPDYIEEDLPSDLIEEQAL